MAQYLFTARQIHRIFLWAVLILGGTMGITGTMLKLGLGGLPIRQIHNNLSPFFILTFVVMAITGLLMYFTPALVRFFKKD